MARLPRAGRAAALALLAVFPAAAEPPPGHGPLQGPTLTGDWGGARTALAERGVRAGARYTAGFWSNLRGGFETGTRYEGFAQWWLETDLEPLLGWRGGGFDLNWYSYHGGQPSADLVGPFPTQTVSGWEAANAVRFYEIILRQTWGDGRFLLKAGQLAADTDFFVSETASELLNGAFGFLGIGRTREISPFYPLAAPGVYLRARTRDARWEGRVGVYSADPGKDVESNFGFDWSFDRGAVFYGELRSRRPFGLPGTYALGVVGTSTNLEDFDSGESASGGVAAYGLIDQVLLEPGRGRPGLGFFLRGYGGPQEDRSLVRWYVDFGLRLTGPIPGRGEDSLSLGVAHLHFSDDYVESQRREDENVSRRETVLELTYRLPVTGWLSLQPDVQLFFDPHFSRRDATVVGVRAVIEL